MHPAQAAKGLSVAAAPTAAYFTRSMANDFQTLQRPLWLVIGRLARRGYAVQPADARDLIHDFYLEEWSR